MNIGAKIKLLRKEKQVTQEELAEYLHISSQAISKWETGVSNPDIDMLPKLAIYFGTSLDLLLDFDKSQVNAAVEQLILESGRGRGNPAESEAFLRKALEKYPNNDILLTCILEDMQLQNTDKSRSAEIVEIGERVLACTQDDEMKIDVLRILAETYHDMGEQAMAEYYLERIPGLHFLYYEIAAEVKSGKERLENIENTECLCINTLTEMLAMRRKEETEEGRRAALERQAEEWFAFLKRYPMYRKPAQNVEMRWAQGEI